MLTRLGIFAEPAAFDHQNTKLLAVKSYRLSIYTEPRQHLSVFAFISVYS